MRYRRSARSAMACASLLMLALVLLGGPAGASGLADSPWPMYQHDPQHTGRSPYVGPENPTVKWRYAANWNGLGNPSIGRDGTIYVPSSRLIALVGVTGAVRWVHSETAKFVSRSVPASAADGTVYVGSSISNELYALTPDGAMQWTFGRDDGLDTQVPGLAARVVTSPAIGPDGAIYFGSTNGRLYAVNSDGSEKWAFITGARIDGSSPAVGHDGTVYVGSWDGNLYAVNPDGTEKWRFAAFDWIGTSPVVAGEGTVYVSSGATIYAVNPDGSERWRWQTTTDADNPHLGTAAIGPDGSVYVASSRGGLNALSAGGALKWTFPTGTTFSTPIIDSAGVVYVGSRDDHIYAIYPDGTEKWRLNVGDDVDGTLIMGVDGGIYVVAGNPTGKDHVLLVGESGSPGTKASASAVVLGGVVAVGGLILYLTRRKAEARR